MGAVEPTSSVTTAGDLSTRTQIHDLVVDFYREIVFDDLLGPVFVDVAEVDWAVHIPILVDYWCRIVLGLPGFQRPGHRCAPSRPRPEPWASEHRDRWYELWTACLDARWSGPLAGARSHAAALMSGMAATCSTSSGRHNACWSALVTATDPPDDLQIDLTDRRPVAGRTPATTAPASGAAPVPVSGRCCGRSPCRVSTAVGA